MEPACFQVTIIENKCDMVVAIPQIDLKSGDGRLAIFATDEMLTLLSKAKRWYVDGTSTIVRRPFAQLLSNVGTCIRKKEWYPKARSVTFYSDVTST